PATEKCMPYANDGGGSWNATKCTPLDASPGQPGDECQAEGDGTSGVDNCALGTMCWFLDAENKGTCIEMCTGSADAPMCPGGKTCDESNDGVIIICLDTCDPLAQTCPDGQICFFDGVDAFICDFDASGEQGKYGDPCEYINVCDYGLFCADVTLVPGCAETMATGCCSPYCNVNDPNTCPGKDAMPGQECVPWYGEDTPPPGQEDIGACAIVL
ncbi:MAG TPA: ribulose phosphate epimerase, partial [Nannocystis sp.]